MSDQSELILERRGAAGLVTLNRPAVLNTVNRAMVRMLRDALERWRYDDAVSRVVVTAAGRAFSAGGDLRAIYEAGRAGRQREALDFWREEYALNAAIKSYPKPYVALIDGIVMGGGAGISVHGSHRVAGDRFAFAMPEVGIGFFPDVGATWFLPRLPGETGTYCALTGARLQAADALSVGIATHRVASAHFGELAEALCGPEPVDTALSRFAVTGAAATSPSEGPIAARREAIDFLFAGSSMEDILSRLDQRTTDRRAALNGEEAAFAAGIAAAIRTKAPLSLKIALTQMRQGRRWSFAQCMRAEFRIVSRVVHGHDLYEGIRAVIIDKDNRPQWRPERLDGVSAQTVRAHFEPLEAELLVDV